MQIWSDKVNQNKFDINGANIKNIHTALILLRWEDVDGQIMMLLITFHHRVKDITHSNRHRACARKDSFNPNETLLSLSWKCEV